MSKLFRKHQAKTGFSLIELLVVISIIGILVVISVAAYSNVRRNARDSRRKLDLENIRQSLVMYRSDQGCYPDGNYSTMMDTLRVEGYWIGDDPLDPQDDAPYDYDPESATTCADGATDGVLSFELSATLEKDDVGYTLSSP